MAELNYHHLHYLWTVTREGSIAAACAALHVSQSTISMQLKALERSLGHKLLERAGRRLQLTEAGRVVYRYADEIFALGRELLASLSAGDRTRAVRLTVGVANVLPKLIVHRLLAPTLVMRESVQLTCIEGSAAQLMGKLAVNELDVVLADAPIDPLFRIRAFSHLLGESPVSAFAAPGLAADLRRGFPRSIAGAAALLPTADTSLRRALERWFDDRGLRPRVLGEFEDSALAMAFGQSGAGLFFAPSVLEKDVQKQFEVALIGRLPDLRERYYAISLERKMTHPAVLAIAGSARGRLFRS